jgi:uncharacterized membrane protein YkvA (DUF1232 family)
MNMAASKALRWGAFRSLVTAMRTATRPGSAGFGARMSSLPRLVASTIRGDYVGTTRGRLFLLLAGVLYVVSPVDLVPELLLPVLGLGDDALVIGWIAASVINETESFLGWERDRDRTVQGHVVP